MIKRLLLISALGALAAACRAPAPVTPDPDTVATEVSRQLTALPSSTSPPTAAPPTAEPPTVTPLPTDSPTPTLTPSPTPTTTPTVVSTDPRLSLGAPTWRDEFNSGSSWGEYDDDHTRVEARDGALVLTAINPDGWSGWTLTWPTPENFYLEATARTGACAGLDRYGVVIRAEGSDQGYLYGFTCDGRFSFRKWDGERFETLLDWTASGAILGGSDQTNRVGVMVRGERYSFYANGNLLADLEEDDYPDGTFGLFIASANTADFTVQVDEIAYWDLP